MQIRPTLHILLTHSVKQFPCDLESDHSQAGADPDTPKNHVMRFLGWSEGLRPHEADIFLFQR